MSASRRIFIKNENIYRDKFVIQDRETAKYLRKVLRLNVGDRVSLFDGEGHEYDAEIGLLRKDVVKGRILDAENSGLRLKAWKRNDQPQFQIRLSLILAQAFPRAGKLDEIVRMNTEIGVSGFLFIESEYSVVKVQSFPESKLDRLSRVAREATRQSERLTIPKLKIVGDFIAALKYPADYKILLHSRQVVGSQDLGGLRSRIPHKAWIILLVGPEGGFSSREVAEAKKAGFKIAYLNLPVMRTETAGVVAGGIILS